MSEAKYEQLYAWAAAATAFERAEARHWVLDSVPNAPAIIARGGIAVVSAVDRHYDGGWPAFLEATARPTDGVAEQSVKAFPYPRRMSQ